MFTFLLLIGWLSFLISGIALLVASKYRKTGITLIILFLAPVGWASYQVSILDKTACWNCSRATFMNNWNACMASYENHEKGVEVCSSSYN